MQEQLDALWMEVMEPQIDGKVVSYLSACHPDYKKLLGRQIELTIKYPIIAAIETNEEEITLSSEEHRAFREYMDNQTEIETLEKAYSFFYGQAAKVLYTELLKELYQDINQAERESCQR